MSGAITAIGSLFGGGALGTAIGTAVVGLGASQLVKSAMPSPSITVPEPEMKTPEMKTPEVPSIVDISHGEVVKHVVEATQQKRRKAAARTQTIYTTPLGLSGSSPTGKKTLLGG